MTKSEVLKRIASLRITDAVMVIGIRGYFKDTMGVPGQNDRGIYDDAMFIVTPDSFKAYNGNTDPSKSKESIAVLQPGIYHYKKGMHGVSGPHPYMALRQDSNVTIKRDGSNELETDSPENRFWIDIHRGGYTTTSSLGCQTIHPDQWCNFRDFVFEAMEKHDQHRVPYILIEA